jgi:hypothetical protein
MCGMEVVLASGEVLRTGMGAMAGNPAWHAHRRGFGPAVDSLFMQSNFGIVTRMGKWHPRPAAARQPAVVGRHRRPPGLLPGRPAGGDPLLYDTTNEAQVKAAYDVYRRLVRLTGEAGYGLYRGHIDFMDDIAAQYGWGDHAMLRLYGTLKDALDPDGILSPGKQGIWPRAPREF